MSASPATVRVGSIVFLGESAPLDRKVTWEVLSISRVAGEVDSATVKSGLTGLTRTVPLDRLRLFRAVETAGAS